AVERARTDDALRERPAVQRGALGAGGQRALLPAAASSDELESFELIGEPREHHRIVIAGDGEHANAGREQPADRAAQVAIRLEEVVVVLDDVAGERDRDRKSVV